MKVTCTGHKLERQNVTMQPGFQVTLRRELAVAICFLVLCCLLLLSLSDTLFAQPTSPKKTIAYKTGRSFAAALKKKVFVSWDQTEVHDILRSLAVNQQVALLLDRRLNPNQVVNLDANNQSVWNVITMLASHIRAKAVIVGNVVYLAPAEAASQVLTVLELRTAERRKLALRVTSRERLVMFRKQTFRWDDLSRPAELFQSVLSKRGIQLVEGSLEVPHDLWRGANLPQMSASEVLTLILIQFDLTFQWEQKPTLLTIVPLPKQLTITKTYFPRKQSPEVAAKEWEQRIPGLTASAGSNEVVVEGTVEQHEQLALLMSGRKASRTKPASTSKSPPLSRREFSLKIENVPAIALIEKLNQSGMTINYNERNLKAAGINLQQRISMNVSKVNADRFFMAICKPLGLQYQIQGTTVTLTPK